MSHSIARREKEQAQRDARRYEAGPGKARAILERAGYLKAPPKPPVMYKGKALRFIK